MEELGNQKSRFFFFNLFATHEKNKKRVHRILNLQAL